MGLKDFEEFSSTEIDEGVSRMDNLVNSKNSSSNKFIYYYIQDCLKGSPGEAVNRHCFKFTRLRDEVYFITCYLVRPDNLYPIHQFNFVVNDKSFWNRFSIYLKDDPNTPLVKSKQYTCLDILKMITNGNIVDKCTINLFQYEIDKLQEIIDDAVGTNKDKLLKYNMVNNASCKIIGYRHFNKRVWYELLSQTIKDPKSEGGIGEIYSEFGSYKEKDSEMYYDPNDPDYKDISFLYL